VSKLLGFDFRVEYKHGTSNIIAGALSHRDIDDSGEISAVSALLFQLFDDFHGEFTGTLALRELLHAVEEGNWGVCSMAW
jgi:hypothetical protein